MNIADRIQTLRKTKNMSQEELADKIGVSRQAVSKWEAEQTTPDIDKIIALSNYFEVTTDYILKGIEPLPNKNEATNIITSKILYVASSAMMAIGLLCAFGGWYSAQSLEVVWGSMIIQVVGLCGYYIGKMISKEKPPIIIQWLNIALLSFMPISMITGILSIMIFKTGWIAPYPLAFTHIILFAVAYLLFNVITDIVIKK